MPEGLDANAVSRALAAGDVDLVAAGLAENDADARVLLHCAAERGDATAMAVLGCWLGLGRGGVKIHSEGFHWLEKAANCGFLDAHFGLASAYGAGKGVKRDPVQALTHLLLAGLDGDVPMACLEELQADLTMEQLDEVQEAVSEWRPACRN